MSFIYFSHISCIQLRNILRPHPPVPLTDWAEGKLWGLWGDKRLLLVNSKLIQFRQFSFYHGEPREMGNKHSILFIRYIVRVISPQRIGEQLDGAWSGARHQSFPIVWQTNGRENETVKINFLHNPRAGEMLHRLVGAHCVHVLRVRGLGEVGEGAGLHHNLVDSVSYCEWYVKCFDCVIAFLQEREKVGRLNCCIS